MRKKLVIVSMQDVDNYGSVLQAYGLKKIFETLEYEVFFENIKPGIFFETKEIKDYYNYKKIDKYILKRIQNKLFFSRKYRKVFCDFRKEFFFLNNKQFYDVAIIGSDEVFNVLAHSPWGMSYQLLGNVPNARKTASYAASCGSTKYSDLPAESIEYIQKNMRNFMKISVRDENSLNFANRLGFEAKIHLDPVLIANFDEEIEKNSFSLNHENFCIVYSYHNRINNKEEINAIKRFAKKNKMVIVSIGGFQNWIDKNICVNPFQVLSLFEKARFIITDTFHGTIFSSKYNGKYAVITQPTNENKLNDLIKRLNIENHVINKISEENLQKIFCLKDKPLNNSDLLHEETSKALNYFKELEE